MSTRPRLVSSLGPKARTKAALPFSVVAQRTGTMATGRRCRRAASNCSCSDAVGGSLKWTTWLPPLRRTTSAVSSRRSGRLGIGYASRIGRGRLWLNIESHPRQLNFLDDELSQFFIVVVIELLASDEAGAEAQSESLATSHGS